MYINNSSAWNVRVRSFLDLLLAMIFVLLWFIYGYIIKLRFDKAVIVCMVGMLDLIIILIISLFESSYFYYLFAIWLYPIAGIGRIYETQLMISIYDLKYLLIVPLILIICFGIMSNIAYKQEVQ